MSSHPPVSPNVTARSSALEGSIAVDGGRSGLRIARITGGDTIPLADGPGLPLLAGPDGPADVAAAIIDPLASAGVRPGTVPALVAGLTGVFEAFDRAPEVAAVLARHLGLESCTITSDVVTSHLGALRGAPGVVAAVGTGTVALAIGPDGTWAKTDGWGFLLGDTGSGFDIGRRGLVAALEYHDGRGGSGALAAAARERFGRLEELTAKAYGAENPVALLASFTPDVAAVARAGDPVASRIWSDAADAVTRAVLGAAVSVFPPGVAAAVSWAGSLLGLDDLLRAPVVSRLRDARPELAMVAPAGTGLDGAVALLDPEIHRRTSALHHHEGTAAG